jgi:hypothetical protein
VTQYTYGLTRLLGHGHAFSQVLPQTKPAAGGGFTYTNDGSYWEIIDLIAFRLVTGGNAANRQVLLTIKDGGGVALATLPAASVQTASLTWDYTWSPEFSNFNTVVATAVTSPLPLIFLQPQFSVVVTIGAVDAADQISNIRLYAERFVTGNEGYLLGVQDTTREPFAELARVATFES